MGAENSKKQALKMAQSSSKCRTAQEITSQGKLSPPQPPAYHEKPSSTSAACTDFTNSTIQASNTPKWRWTRSQCQAWIYSVLTTYCEREATYATVKAAEFEGFGLELYMKSYNECLKYLGNKEGRAVYTLILEVRSERSRRVSA
jgi:hypothetical protein